MRAIKLLWKVVTTRQSDEVNTFAKEVFCNLMQKWDDKFKQDFINHHFSGLSTKNSQLVVLYINTWNAEIYKSAKQDIQVQVDIDFQEDGLDVIIRNDFDKLIF